MVNPDKISVCIVEYDQEVLTIYNILKLIILMRVPKLAGRPGRGNQSPGSGGAPKF